MRLPTTDEPGQPASRHDQARPINAFRDVLVMAFPPPDGGRPPVPGNAGTPVWRVNILKNAPEMTASVFDPLRGTVRYCRWP